MIDRSSRAEVFCKNVFLEISQNSQENTCARVSFLLKFAGLRRATLSKYETLAQTFSCEFCEISKNNFFTEYLQETASVWLCLSKLEKLLTESEELKEASFDKKLESLIVGSWNLLKNIWILIITKLKTFSLQTFISFSALCGTKIFQSNLYIFKLKEPYES